MRSIISHFCTLHFCTLATHVLPRFERTKADLVQFIRSNDSLREVWEQTPTAELYTLPVFENKKKDKGYFF